MPVKEFLSSISLICVRIDHLCSKSMFYNLCCKAFADIIIQVLDENDNPPVFKENSYEAAVAENSIAGTNVVPVSRKLSSTDIVIRKVRKQKSQVRNTCTQ